MEQLESTTGGGLADLVTNAMAVGAAAFADDKTIGGTPVAIIHKDYRVKLLHGLREQPSHVSRAVQAHTPDGLLAYWNRFATEHSTLYVNPRTGEVNGIIDHATPDGPAWEAHKVAYKCPTTPEWDKWRSGNGKEMGQAELAEWIEDNAPEIVSPPAAEMLEIAQTIQATKGIQFKSAIRLDNGQVQMTYNEVVDGQAGASGQLKIPAVIELGIQLFAGGPAYAMSARFRYRVRDGRAVMWYQLVRPHVCVEDAIRDVVQRIRDGVTTGHVIEAEYTRDQDRDGNETL